MHNRFSFKMYLAGYLLCLSGCVPVFSDLQSARTVGQGKVELTPGVSQHYIVDSDNSEDIQQNLGLQFAYGLTPRLDFRMRYEYIRNDFGSSGARVVGLGLKYGILPDILAIYVPVGGIINPDFEERFFQTQPTLLLTLPLVADKLELNTAAKSIIYLEDGDNSNVAWNVGLGLSTNLKKWAIRPEYGRLYELGSPSAPFSHFSLGFSWVF